MNEVSYKGYNIVGDGTYGMCSIKTQGRGSLPKGLQGVYTKSTLAMQAIDGYVSGKEKDSDGEADKRS